MPDLEDTTQAILRIMEAEADQETKRLALKVLLALSGSQGAGGGAAMNDLAWIIAAHEAGRTDPDPFFEGDEQ